MRITTLCVIAFLNFIGGFAQTIWDGPIIEFTKDDFADPLLEVNQDRISDLVWITRASNMGIFNAFSEDAYSAFISPTDTEWAFGTTAELASLTFDTWENTHDSSPLSTLGNPMVVHLITDDVYIDLTFTAWTSGANGGGFTYERTTDPLLNNYVADDRQFGLWPNPSTSFFKISGISDVSEVSVFDIHGRKVLYWNDVRQEQLFFTSELSGGLYFVKVDNNALKRLLIMR